MNTIFTVASLLSVYVLQTDAFTESLKANVSVWPSGSKVYHGECLLLQCKVESRSFCVWNYRWYRSNPQTAASMKRHLVHGDRYFITAVTREDADMYWCEAECRMNQTLLVKAQPVTLSVPESPHSLLSVIPNTRLMLRGENFTVQCPSAETNSSKWKLLRFSSPWVTPAVLVASSPLGGGVKEVFTADMRNSGLYWCEGAEGRTNAVNISVSYSNIILKTPAFSVFTSDEVVLYCLYRTGTTHGHNKTIFFKNGAEIDANISSSSNGVIKMTIKNVTREHEGMYKCASRDRKMESPESWLSVRPDDFTSTEGIPASSSGSWKWIIVSVVVVLVFLIPLTSWLVWHHRYQMFNTRSCWPVPKQDVPAAVLPATKQDVTEVQWDLSWMEMSSLLDK